MADTQEQLEMIAAFDLAEEFYSEHFREENRLPLQNRVRAIKEAAAIILAIPGIANLRLLNDIEFRASVEYTYKVLSTLRGLNSKDPDYSAHRQEMYRRLDDWFLEKYRYWIEALTWGMVNARAGDEGLQWSRKVAFEMEESLKEANRILQEIHKVAAEATVGREGGRFEKLAENYETQSRWWMGGAIAFVLVFVVLLITDWFWSHAAASGEPSDSAFQLSRYIISKASALAIIGAGAGVCLRMFTSLRHNSIINRHRATALSTFDIFSNSAKTDDVKDAVLLETTKAIFAPQSSGMVKNSGDGQSDISVVELVRKVVAKDT